METKAYRILSAITVLASALICLYYFVYLLLCIAGIDARLMSLFALFVMACAALPVIFHNKLRRLFGKAYTVLHIIFTVLLCVYIISVAVFWAYIGLYSANSPYNHTVVYASQNDTGENTAIMVFGCRIYGTKPSLTLRLRLDAAYHLLDTLPDAICIVSGGQGSDEPIPEAQAMHDYLVSRGIREERIIMESRAHSTSENIRLTKELIDELGISDKKLIGVSTAFHLPRIKLLSERHGLPMALCSSPSPSFAHHYVSMVREYLSYIKMAIFDRAVIITKVT